MPLLRGVQVAGTERRDQAFMSRGTMLPTTETTPRPPMAISGSVRLSSPGSTVRSVSASDLRGLIHRAGRLFDGDDRRDLGDAGDRFRLDVLAGPPRNVVKHDGQVDRLRDRLEMAEKAFLRRLVVVGRRR